MFVIVTDPSTGKRLGKAGLTQHARPYGHGG